MDHPPLSDPNLDERCKLLESSFRRIVASQPFSSKTSAKKLRFVKRDTIMKMKLSSAASKYKAIVLFEKWLVVHMTGLWPSPQSIEV